MMNNNNDIFSFVIKVKLILISINIYVYFLFKWKTTCDFWLISYWSRYDNIIRVWNRYISRKCSRSKTLRYYCVFELKRHGGYIELSHSLIKNFDENSRWNYWLLFHRHWNSCRLGTAYYRMMRVIPKDRRESVSHIKLPVRTWIDLWSCRRTEFITNSCIKYRLRRESWQRGIIPATLRHRV